MLHDSDGGIKYRMSIKIMAISASN